MNFYDEDTAIGEGEDPDKKIKAKFTLSAPIESGIKHARNKRFKKVSIIF